MTFNRYYSIAALLVLVLVLDTLALVATEERRAVRPILAPTPKRRRPEARRPPR